MNIQKYLLILILSIKLTEILYNNYETSSSLYRLSVLIYIFRKTKGLRISLRERETHIRVSLKYPSYDGTQYPVIIYTFEKKLKYKLIHR